MIDKAKDNQTQGFYGSDEDAGEAQNTQSGRQSAIIARGNQGKAKESILKERYEVG